MKRSLLLTTILLPTLMLAANAQSRLDTMLTMSDGVQINVAFFLPDEPVPEGGFPAVLSVHGFAGNKNGNVNRVVRYADSGYAGMTFSVRGQGHLGVNLASGGVTDWLDAPRTIEDVRELYEWMAARPDVRGDRIAIEGISQGGVITWSSVIDQIPFRCAVPIASVPAVKNTFAPNGTNTYFTVTILNLAKSSGAVLFGPFLDSVRNAYQADAHARLLELLASRETAGTAGIISVPVFSQLAWQDDLFLSADLFELFRNATNPMKLTLIPGGHSTNTAVEWLREETFRFYRRWLRDDVSENIMDPDSRFSYIDPSTDDTVAHSREEFSQLYPANRAERPTLTLNFQPRGSLATAGPFEPLSMGKLYVQNITNNADVFRSEILEEKVVITGATLSCLALSTAPTWQINIRLYDFDPETNTRRQITRGSWQARDGMAERRITYDLSPQIYTLPAGHIVEAHIYRGIPLLKPNTEFGKTPYAPQATGITTFKGTAEEPATLTLWLSEEISSVEEIDLLPAWLDLR